MAALFKNLTSHNLLRKLLRALLDLRAEELGRAYRDDGAGQLLPRRLLVLRCVLEACPVRLEHAPQAAGLFHTLDPVIQSARLDGRGVVALALDEHLPELALVALDEHLGHVRDPEEAQVPAPHAPRFVLRRDVVHCPERALLEPEPGQQHLAKAQAPDAVAQPGRDRVRELGAAVLAVHVKGLVPELVHERGHVGDVGRAVVALGRWRLVRVPEAAQVGRDEGEVRRQQREQPVPVEAVFGRPV